MEYTIALLAFGCVFTFVMGVSIIMRAKPAERRLASLSPNPLASERPRASMVRTDESRWAGLFRRLGERKKAPGVVESETERVELGRMRTRFIHGGFKNPAAPAIFYGVRLCFAIGLPVFASLFPAVWDLGALKQLVLMGTLTAVGYLAPSIYVDRRVTSRKAAITRALPDSLDLMVVCVEAGLGINQALARVAKEFEDKSPLLSAEFSLVGNEARAGKTTTEALRGLADRTGVSDVSSLVALLVQTERFGTSVADALRVHADAMRIRRMQYAEERAQKATLKLILPSTMIFTSLLLIFVAPGMYNFFEAFSGIE